ncbi:TetR/AcrR family transcriptional regulator [Pontixanthobacter aestiaquae]|uniref:TetR family transcriptional regulator n=1 Tax=Pontixanthobacter aestiaquae TaxID=1509367 RepID=A0A844Z3A5_9SPHN|nr:TetR/AcrR family transcriptional regulator [Pontixanthobacter aestiaquae]MDN3646600.1 TetR/AcrR family transcriptional regulator [Pontixanthobacter aestiaquae]MXO82415.1 TetR family transcriptional regulator [Pontixanthobacter aestiaquae]
MIRSEELSPKAEATRTRVLDTAAGLFWRRNYHGVSLDEVAAQAGVNKATIYRYYLDKAELVTAVMAANGEKVIAKVFEPAFAASASPEGRLCAIYQCLYRAQSSLADKEDDVFGCPIAGLALELGQELPSLRESAREIFDRVESYLLIIASDAVAEGKASGWTDTALARTLVQLLHGGFASSRLSVEPIRMLEAGNASLALIGSKRRLSYQTGEIQ